MAKWGTDQHNNYARRIQYFDSGNTCAMMNQGSSVEGLTLLKFLGTKSAVTSDFAFIHSTKQRRLRLNKGMGRKT